MKARNSAGLSMVEPRGIEPLTSTMPLNEPRRIPPILLEQVKHMTETPKEQKQISVPIGPKERARSGASFANGEYVSGIERARQNLAYKHPAHYSQCKAGFVYFIQAGSGPIKIGRALVPERRMAELQTGNHEVLILAAVASGGRVQERKYHDTFAEHLIHGETLRDRTTER